MLRKICKKNRDYYLRKRGEMTNTKLSFSTVNRENNQERNGDFIIDF